MVGKKRNKKLSEIAKMEKTTEKTATRKMDSRKLGNQNIRQRKMTAYVKGKRKVIWCPEETATVVQASEKNGNWKMGIYLHHAAMRMIQLQAYDIRVRLKTTDTLTE